MNSQTKLKRVVIKEEFVRLTGDHIKALILNQFLYWSERVKDFDKFIKEEKERFSVEDDDLNIDLAYGWIYKSADELIDELMLNISAVTIRRHLKHLIKAGYIDQRHNPNHKWDRTWQYRPNIIAIQTDLEAMGFSLDGYPLLMKDATFKMKDGNFKMKDRNVTGEGAIPETTTETTTDINGSAKNPQNPVTPIVEAIRENNFDRADQAERDNLNALADAIAKVCGNINMNTVHPKTRDELKQVTLSLYGQSVTPDDLKAFGVWWYDTPWQGKKGQPPTLKQLGDMWGQFEAQKVINVPSIDTSKGFYV